MQLSALRWQVQPVTTFDMVRLLLPFMFCQRDHRDKLAQFVENITLAQALGAHQNCFQHCWHRPLVSEPTGRS
jgi:hypothetical protein